MSVVFSKTSKNKNIACCSGYSYYFKSASKFDHEVSFISCTEYWDDDVKCMAKVFLLLIFIFKNIFTRFLLHMTYLGYSVKLNLKKK